MMNLVKIESKDPMVWMNAVTVQTNKVFKELETVKKIKNMDDFNKAAGLLKFLKQTAKLAKTKQPARPEDPFATFFGRVTKLDKHIKDAMKVFLEANRAKVEALDAQVTNGSLKNISKYVAKVNALSVDSEHASTRKTWKAVIVDESKIPRQFMMPDAAIITHHLRTGGNPIPGVSWEQVEGITI